LFVFHGVQLIHYYVMLLFDRFLSLVMVRENVTNTLIMIQPTLMAYSLEAPTQPV
jgi:hypothetical protein